MPMRRLFLFVILSSLFVWPSAAQDNAIQDIIAIRVDAGFDGLYRPDQWLPLQVRVQNNGADVTGRLIVRPESSGDVVSNAFSTPIDLPSGSDKVAFLYVQVRDFAEGATIELLDEAGLRVGAADFRLTPIEARDKLHVVLSGTAAETLPLGNLAPGGVNAFTVRWTAANVPDYTAGLQAVDTIFLYNLDSATLTQVQRAALQDWVALGGHLIVLGGPNWQLTAAAFTDELPFVPDGTQTVDGLAGLATYVGRGDIENAETVIATGIVSDAGRVLAMGVDDVPLLVRGQHGAGTMDYLVADPSLEPLNSWDGIGDFWVQILASTPPQPGWQRGFLDTGATATAVAVLPEIELLPPVLQMLGYIVAYIALIGPLNYIVLSRINRREWAWFTIPLFIVAFSIMAWTVGFNLRGNNLILSRLNVVQVFPETETARVDQLVGVLSPRRETYVMETAEDRFLRVMPGLATGGFLQRNITQSTAEIVQQGTFRAENITIDGGIFANFSTTGVVTAPPISGSMTISYEDGQRWQGLVRNDSDIALTEPVLLLRNRYYVLPGTLQPGAIESFDTDDLIVLRDSDDLLALPSPLESSFELELGDLRTTRSEIFRSLQSSRVIQGDLEENERNFLDERGTPEAIVRRDAFLRSFLRDQYNSPAIGDTAYLVGWSDTFEADIQIEGVNARDVETALYIVQLETTVETPPTTQVVRLDPDQFTWTILERDLAEGGNEELRIFSEGFVEMRFTPLPGAVLTTVDSMTIALDRGGRRGRDVVIELWDWGVGEWVALDNTRLESYQPDPARFAGPGNIVDARLSFDIDTEVGTADSTLVNNLRITQAGRF